MVNLPASVDDFDKKGFVAWLKDQGTNVLSTTNEWEVVRYQYKGLEAPTIAFHRTAIVYHKKNGNLTWTDWSNKHYKDFLVGRDLGEKSKPKTPKTTKAKKQAKEQFEKKKPKAHMIRDKLRERDGDDCFYCGLPLEDDATIEHIIPKAEGGGNMLVNLALAHYGCNQEAADKSVHEKIVLRETKRNGNGKKEGGDTPPWDA